MTDHAETSSPPVPIEAFTDEAPSTETIADITTIAAELDQVERALAHLDAGELDAAEAIGAVLDGTAEPFEIDLTDSAETETAAAPPAG